MTHLMVIYLKREGGEGGGEEKEGGRRRRGGEGLEEGRKRGVEARGRWE